MIVKIDFGSDFQLPNKNTLPWQNDLIEFIQKWSDESINCFAVKSSGSTSLPKEIQFTRADLLQSARRTNTFFKLSRHSVFLNCLPLNHIAGIMMTVRAIVAGGKLLYVKPSSNPLTELNALTWNIDFAAFTPMQVFEILRNEETTKRFSSIRNIIIGGAKISNELADNLAHCSNNIYETYGMTETVSHIALRQIAPVFSNCFEVMDQVEIKSGASDNLLIHIAGKEWIETNDIISIIDSNKFIWRARMDDVINTGGEKVYMNEIESSLSNSIGFPFYITKVHDCKLGEKVAIVTDSDVRIEILKSILADTLSAFQRPRIFIQIKQIKKSSLGKMLRYFSDDEIIRSEDLSYS